MGTTRKLCAYLRTLSRVEAQSYLRHMEGSGIFTTDEFWGVAVATQTDDDRASLARLMTITRSSDFSDPSTLGPGGLDPEAVYDTLTRELKDALEMEDDVSAVLAALRKLPRGEARAHVRRLEDSVCFRRRSFGGSGGDAGAGARVSLRRELTRAGSDTECYGESPLFVD